MSVEMFSLQTNNTRLVWESISQESINSGSYLASGRLRIKPCRGTRVRTVFDDKVYKVDESFSLPIRPLFEQCTYRLSLKSTAGERVAVKHIDSGIQDRLFHIPDTPEHIVGDINFRSHVGFSEFEVWVENRQLYTFEVEVFPTKLDYKEDFELMMAEVQEIMAGLAFEYLKSTYIGGKIEPTGQQTNLEWVILFEHILEDLKRSLRQIARNPIRGLRRDEHMQRLEQISKVDGALRRAIRKGQGKGQSPIKISGLNLKAKYFAAKPQYSLDTPEHRWLDFQLKKIQQKLSKISLQEKARKYHRPENIQKFNQFERTVASLQMLEPLRECSFSPNSAGFSSLQLMSSSGYREAYKALIILQMGLRVEGNALNLSLKDISTLYEYWCYLAIVRLLAEQMGYSFNLRDVIDVKQSGLKVRLKQGRESTIPFKNDAQEVDLVYNPHISQEALLTHKPDIMLKMQRNGWPTVRAVLDAKYRLDDSEQTVQALGLPAPPQDALNVLHRYRDAILYEEKLVQDLEPATLSRSVIQGLALYPYTVQSDTQYPSSRLYKVFQRIGIGAIPFVPTQVDYVKTWLESFLNSTPWSLAVSDFPSVLQPSLRHSATESVLVGTLRGTNTQEHLDWVFENKMYYFPYINSEHGRQWNLKWAALFLPQGLSGENFGAVIWKGRVKRIEVVDRDDLSVPWGSSRKQSRAILCHIDSWEKAGPILNLLSEPMQNRWTTSLGLTCAGNINELLLETVPEWLLYERLKKENIDFRIKATKVPKLEDYGPGHASFVIDKTSQRIVYLGSRGFEISFEDGNSQIVGSVERVIRKVISSYE